MGLAHLQVLTALGLEAVAGWAPSARRRDAVTATGADLLGGTLEEALGAFRPTHAIVASPVETLAGTAMAVLAAGVRDVLIEKPAAMSSAEGARLAAAVAAARARVYVGYNRRFYASVRTALSRMRGSGESVSSVFFAGMKYASSLAGSSIGFRCAYP